MFSVEDIIKEDDRFKYGLSDMGCIPRRIKFNNRFLCFATMWLNNSCGMAGLSYLTPLKSIDEKHWPAFVEFLKKVDGCGYTPKRFQFVTTAAYVPGSGLFKKLVEESTLLLEYKNHSHESRPNLLYMLDLGNA